MKSQLLFLSLPLDTWIIIGGLYILAALLPTFIALIMKHREEEKQNE